MYGAVFFQYTSKLLIKKKEEEEDIIYTKANEGVEFVSDK